MTCPNDLTVVESPRFGTMLEPTHKYFTSTEVNSIECNIIEHLYMIFDS
jgi:hypothetical protein